MSDATSHSLLPSNSTPLERALEHGSARQIGLLDVDLIRTLKDASRVPEAFLPVLAWELSVDFWDDSWSLEVKRGVVGSAIEVHRKKGTKLSLRRVFDALSIDVEFVRDRWSPTYTPHTFECRLPVATNAGLQDGTVDVGALLEWLDNTASRRDNYALNMTDQVTAEQADYVLSDVMSAPLPPSDGLIVQQAVPVISDVAHTPVEPTDALTAARGNQLFFFHLPAPKNRRLH